MVLDSYVCEVCILQREETIIQLFIRCNFAKACWVSIGIRLPVHLPILALIKFLKGKLDVPFYMDIAIISAGVYGKREMVGFVILLLQLRKDAETNSS